MSLKDYIFSPDQDPVSYDYYKKQEACDWSVEEFDFTKERDDYLKSPKNIQTLMKKIIGFFLIGDGLISETLIVYIQKAIEDKNWPKVFYLSMQLKIENTHAETYSKAALTIIPENEHSEIIQMCEEKECLKKKARWVQKYTTDYLNEGMENVACAVGEGVFFIAQFAIIFYMRKLNLFKNFINSNEKISPDETLHRNQKCSEAKEYFTKIGYPEKEVESALELIKDGVEVEKIFARDLLSEGVLGEQSDKDAGLTIENLEGYIEMLADQICYLIGFPIIYGTKVELKWMDDINMLQKVNFYENDNVASYRKFTPKNQEDVEEEKEVDLEDLDGIDF